jgi:hypothetical protein
MQKSMQDASSAHHTAMVSMMTVGSIALIRPWPARCSLRG